MKQTAQDLEIIMLRSQLLTSENNIAVLKRKLSGSVSREEYEAKCAECEALRAEEIYQRKLREETEQRNRELKDQNLEQAVKISELESENRTLKKEKAENEELAAMMKKENLDGKSVADMLRGLLYNHSSEKLEMEATEMFGDLPEGKAALLAMAAEYVRESSGQPVDERKKRIKRKKAGKSKGTSCNRQRGSYGRYGVEMLEHIGVDTSGMEPGARVILRKGKADNYTVQLLYMSPGKVYSRTYDIGRMYVPGTGQTTTSHPKDEFLKGCPVSASLATFYWTGKCQYNLSEQKMLSLLEKMGCKVPQQTLNTWMHRVSDFIHDKLYNVMTEEIRGSRIVNMDETRLCVRSESEGKISYNTEYVHGTLSLEKRLFIMTYREGTRSHDVPEEMLRNSDIRIIMADRCSIYPKAIKDIGEGVIDRAADWVHGRRYAWHSYKSDHRIKGVLEKITRLFQLERLYRERGLTAKQRFVERMLISKLIVDAIFAELRAIKANIDNYGKIVRWMVDYFLDDEEAFRTFLRYGELDIDNNAIERLFRNLAMGRRTWEHIGSHRAARNISFMYSLLESCKLNGIDFGEYLAYMLQYINNNEINIADLLPNRVKLPSSSQSAA